MGRVGNGRAAGAVVVAAAVLAVSAAPVAQAAGPGRCARGRVCAWSGQGTTGAFCSWRGDDRNWRGGKRRCGFRVNSIWNRGRGQVTFYASANYRGQITDPLPATPRPLNAADIAIRSHRWSR
ncbi:peptidase inhibitor family I36 protein [Actinomadura hibisca]|uniref:peptidase inhibitor family I36 protein n=1 Tax=Actinomadura hibisca TaxID=68565 RepID=UPI0008321093|nr:peptidase inhibitor family I36 protein [Actinomadura hibisca]